MRSGLRFRWNFPAKFPSFLNMVLRRRKAYNMSVDVETKPNTPPDVAVAGATCPKGDVANVLLLIALYMMQGIPLGLSAAVPYILQSDPNTASYQTQATFSLVTWPFSLKLLWAPLVDAIYSTRFGRRKSWLIPVQYAIGVDLLVLASNVDSWLGREPGKSWGPLAVTHPVNIYSLTVAFFGLTLLAATQDIAVDGWAITMLSKQNLGWASTCNSVGQILGYMVAFVLFLFLESPHIANSFIRGKPVTDQGFITFSGFLYFWGITFMVLTTLVALFKHEAEAARPLQKCLNGLSKRLCDTSAVQQLKTTGMSLRPRLRGRSPQTMVGDDDVTEITEVGLENEDVVFDQAEDNQRVMRINNQNCWANSRSGSVIEVSPEDSSFNQGDPAAAPAEDSSNHGLSLCDTYRVTIGVLWLKPVLTYIALLLIVKFCFAACDSVTTLKMIEHGVSKEHLAFLQMLLVPLQVVLPLLITRWTNGPRPLLVFTTAAIVRIILSVLVIPLVHYTPAFRQEFPVGQTANGTASSTASGSTQYTYPWTFYGTVLAYSGIIATASNFMFVSTMSFHARISDPAVGGTYMTLLNTATNLAGTLPSSLMLYLVDPLSIRHCMNPNLLKAGVASWNLATSGNATDSFLNNATGRFPAVERLLQLGEAWIVQNATCKVKHGVQHCELAGGECVTTLDGFYLEVGFSVVLGLFTFPLFARRLAKYLDSLPASAFYFRLPKNSCLAGRRRRKRSVSS
ncbi:Acetyl-coenzyme A transporter 1 [Clonorchis sinensis]|uniref:Acetyl-coenzyme A transporter 1 n=1 Tax=Clonorchis sinensis TaxID=79923 RepID=A0A3R7GKN3_CLOSI|nr:Acetyl-coenzyme A transporter 1 [Clonorchis sinensis]